jgi:hypothetical protein
MIDSSLMRSGSWEMVVGFSETLLSAQTLREPAAKVSGLTLASHLQRSLFAAEDILQRNWKSSNRQLHIRLCALTRRVTKQRKSGPCIYDYFAGSSPCLISMHVFIYVSWIDP